jgi:hypothetical protein
MMMAHRECVSNKFTMTTGTPAANLQLLCEPLA